MRHKVPPGTDTTGNACYTRYLENSDRLRSLDIRWRHVWTLLRVASLRARPHKTGDTGCSGQREEALLMTEKNPEGRSTQERPRCQISHFPGKPSPSCEQPAKENVDGLLLCEKHAVEAKLEGQIYCWDEMLFH